MTAAALAKLIARRAPDLPAPSAVAEGDESVDGEIVYSPTVHVQVPNLGGVPNVGIDNRDDSFTFKPARARAADLIADLRAALALAPTGAVR